MFLTILLYAGSMTFLSGPHVLFFYTYGQSFARFVFTALNGGLKPPITYIGYVYESYMYIIRRTGTVIYFAVRPPLDRRTTLCSSSFAATSSTTSSSPSSTKSF
jgi:hypothetical protein